MIGLIKRNYALMARLEPGMRFRQFYNLKHGRIERSWWNKWRYTLVGVGLVVVGVVFSVLPVFPGTLFVILGFGLLAGRSYTVATFLDAVELSLRTLWKDLRRSR